MVLSGEAGEPLELLLLPVRSLLCLRMMNEDTGCTFHLTRFSVNSMLCLPDPASYMLYVNRVILLHHFPAGPTLDLVL